MSISYIDPTRIFYHGTSIVFERFDEEFKGSNTGWDNTVHGFFFADKIENAQLFGDFIIRAQLNIQTPIDFRLQSIFSRRSQASVIWEILTGEQLNKDKALRLLNNEISLGEIQELYDSLNTNDAHQILVQQGYDGIISSMGNQQDEFITFCPDQISIVSIERTDINNGLGR